MQHFSLLFMRGRRRAICDIFHFTYPFHFDAFAAALIFRITMPWARMGALVEDDDALRTYRSGKRRGAGGLIFRRLAHWLARFLGRADEAISSCLR